jgi:hypothetical protein
MNTGKAFVRAVCATLAALVGLAAPLHANQVDPATGVVGSAALSQGSPEGEQPSAAATGVGMTASDSSQQAESAAQAEVGQANVDRSGVLVGHSAESDQVAAPTPAATGVGR